MGAKLGLERWHAALAAGSKTADLEPLIAQDAVFHSPVVHTPQRGRTIVAAYLSAAGATLGGEQFRYVRQLIDGKEALLEFETELDGIHINGIDLIRFDEDAQIADFKVMIRPLQAVNKVWEVMRTQLERQSRS